MSNYVGGVSAQDTTARCNLQQLFCAAGSLKTGTLPVVATPLKRFYYKSLSMPDYSDVHYELNYCPFACPIPENNPPTGCDTEPRIALYYYVYYPTNINYAQCALPALIMFHGGGYSECSSPDQEGLEVFCKEMASRGFVVFSVQYRVGILADERPIPNVVPPTVGPKEEYVSAQQILGIYRACQDARGAIRSIIKRNDEETIFKINTDNIFIGGMSAGSLIAMNAAYYQDQAQINAVFPNVSTALGNINPDFYYADAPADIEDDYFPKIKGVLNCWGSMFIPQGRKNNPFSVFATNINNPPMISFAGVQDGTFDIHYQDIYFSKRGAITKNLCNISFAINFGRETHCLLTSPYLTSQNQEGDQTYIRGIGSSNIFEMLNSNGIFTELYLDCEMFHGLDNADDPACTECNNNYSRLNTTGCPPCGYQSNFGVNIGTIADTYDYMAGRAATFFQAIITGTTSIVINKKFVEQENKRYGCNTPDNPTSFTPNTCDIISQ